MTAWCSQDQKVYVWGGLYHEDVVLKKCEVYDVKKDRWESIKSMNLKRKNPSSTVTKSGLLYVFGGSIPTENERETIERYDPIKNSWEILPVKLNNFFDSQIIFKTSSTTILIVGGNMLDFSTEQYERSDRVFRLFTQSNYIQEEIPLPKPVYSIYPGFIDNTNFMIIDEDHAKEQPTVVIYSIAMFLPGVTADGE